MYVGLVVYDSLESLSGGYRYDRKLVDHLEACGDTVDVITIPRKSYARNLTDNFSRSLRGRLNRSFDVLVQDELCHPSLIRHNVHLDRPTTIVALVHLLSAVEPETRWQSLSRIVEPRYLTRVDAALCTSEDTARRLDTAVPSAVAYPGGRRGGAALSPETVRERAHADPFRITFLGTAIERKGLATLVEALSTLDGEWSATVVGRLDADPSYVERVKNALTGASLAGRVDLRGTVADETLERVLERSHILAIPSQYESFGMAYLEAMEYGVVPIATRVGGPREFVEDETSGVLVDPDDPQGLCETLAALEADRDRLASLARGALDAADAHPTWSESMDLARSFLIECVEQNRTSASDHESVDGTATPSRSHRSEGERV